MTKPEKKFQNQLLELIQSKYPGPKAISDRTLKAFQNTPRHLFVERFRNEQDSDWIEVNEKNLESHLPLLYADYPVALNSSPASTISQPSFVLKLIDLLEIQEGDRIFELGTASGWNAALMSRLAGPSGKVITLEIIPELARSAAARLKRMGYENVKVIEGDAGHGAPEYAPFDRMVFTAGAYDLPFALHEQIKIGGTLLFVLKNKDGPDQMIRLRKKKDFFESDFALQCWFVPVTGKYNVSVEKLEELPKTDRMVLRVYRSDSNLAELRARSDGIIASRRPESTFIWSP